SAPSNKDQDLLNLNTNNSFLLSQHIFNNAKSGTDLEEIKDQDDTLKLKIG
ncbi:35142_t:CDS:2, partial [Racocetra persica]